ncbi:hypothetical protein [Arhodomonas sp. AD133]|uniref:hypothetical protein n=1 Tax=Arhodomonas sp. AD133 TaxID=3415009 RepID=UPI003EBA4161
MEGAENRQKDPIVVSGRSHKKVQSLINASHRKLLHLETVVDWSRGVDFSKPPKIEEAGWLYGTSYWDGMTAEQKNEVLWLETARDVS